MFNLLLGINGVGSKAALSLLSISRINNLKYAIITGDDKCKLKIENEKTDIFNQRKKFENLTEKDKESINNCEREFNTREEAEEAISELIS